MISTNDLRPGTCFIYDGQLWKVTEFQHVKPGKGPAFVRIKQMNLRTGAIVERTYRTGEKVENIRVENREMQYLYRDGDNFVFMDNETFEQYSISSALVGEGAGYLVENSNATVTVHENEILDVSPPNFIEVEVMKTDPGVRGDTAQGGSKPAVIASGATIMVPLFINEGEMIKVDTRDGRYIERVK
ncbi:MAG TPA: elongation factor P [Firmicutes bacterium]|nr:elongation factor P [Bacillota bacterium]